MARKPEAARSHRSHGKPAHQARKPGPSKPGPSKGGPSKPGPSTGGPARKPAPAAPQPAVAKAAAQGPATKPAAKAPATKSAPRSEAPRPVRAKRPEPEGPHRAGFAVLLGRPNVGKSTLLNRLVGEHVAIVSPRPQTTRTRILGVVTRPNTQLALLDAPGVHRAKGAFNRGMVEQAMGSVRDADVVLFLAEAGWPADVDPTRAAEVDPVGPFHRELLEEIGRTGKPVLLVLTKIDLLQRPLLLPLMETWAKAFPFREIYPLSALTGANMDGLLDAIRKHLPEGPQLFPSDTVTDQTERALCSEYIREQVFLQTRDEIPYATAVLIEDFDESERPLPDEADEAATQTLGAGPVAAEPATSEEGDEAVASPPARPQLGPGLVRIQATIMLERASHKAIVIGKGGDRLKRIGTISRLHIERLLGCRVWLGLHVRVVPGWTEKSSMLAELGYTPSKK